MPLFEILYHDDALVAINKPIGWFVHRSEFDRQEEKIILQYLRDQIGTYLYPVHRLDRPTSGVLLFALSQNAASKLSAQFRENRPQKIYHAIVRGFPPADGTMENPLQREVANQDEPMWLEATTHYVTHGNATLPIAVNPYPTARYSLLELNPITGRMHQIRRHLKHLSHPIIGDTSHGDLRHNRAFESYFNYGRLWLHATHLTFNHPATEEIMTLSAPWDNQWRETLSAMNWASELDQPNKSHFLNHSILNG